MNDKNKSAETENTENTTTKEEKEKKFRVPFWCKVAIFPLCLVLLFVMAFVPMGTAGEDGEQMTLIEQVWQMCGKPTPEEEAAEEAAYQEMVQARRNEKRSKFMDAALNGEEAPDDVNDLYGLYKYQAGQAAITSDTVSDLFGQLEEYFPDLVVGSGDSSSADTPSDDVDEDGSATSDWYADTYQKLIESGVFDAYAQNMNP